MILNLIRSIIICSLFICSFGEISNLSNLSTNIFSTIPISINSAQAGFNYQNCLNKLDDKKACDEMKSSYRKCLRKAEDDDDLDEDDCEDESNNAVNAMGQQELRDQAATLQNLSSVSSDTTTFWIQVGITILVEMVSGVMRLWGAWNSTSAWLHFGASVLLLIYFVIVHFAMDRWKDMTTENLQAASTSYSGTLSQTNIITSSTALKDQKNAIIKEKKLMEGFESLYNSHSWATGITSALFFLAAIAAVLEIFTCILTFGATGCTYNGPEKKNKYFSKIENLLNALTPPLLAQTSETAENFTVEQNDISGSPGSPNSNQGGKTVATWVTTGLTAIAPIFLGNAAMVDLSTRIATNTAGKVVPVLRVASFIVSAVTMLLIALKFDDLEEEFAKRSDLLNDLKDSLVITNIESNENGAPGSSGGSQAGATVNSDTRGINGSNADSTGDFISGNCVFGNGNNGNVSADLGCGSKKKLELTIPKIEKVEMGTSGFDTAGISTDPNEHFEAIQKLASGDGLKSFDKVAPRNNAVLQRSINRFLKKLKTDPKFKQLSKDMTIDEALQKAKSQRQERVKNLTASLSSGLAASTSDLSKQKEKEKDSDDFVKQLEEKKAKTKSTKKPDKKNKKLNLISFGDSSDSPEPTKKIKDEKDIVVTDAKDIVNEPEITIWEVINVRYKKSAWRKLLKKRQ